MSAKLLRFPQPRHAGGDTCTGGGPSARDRERNPAPPNTTATRALHELHESLYCSEVGAPPDGAIEIEGRHHALSLGYALSEADEVGGGRR